MPSLMKTLRNTSQQTAIMYVAVAAFTTRLLFWIAVQWTIEDGMIIGRIVRNFTSHGILSFNVNDRVSTATSPIFALVTALLAKVTNLDPIVAIKLVSLVFAVITCLLMLRILSYFLPFILAAIATSIYIFLPPIIAYSTNGLETAMYTMLCCAAMERLYVLDEKNAIVLAAFSTLVRPDGATVLMLVGIAILWMNRSNWRTLAQKSFPAVVILAIGFGVHYVYYGSVFPQTVTAKLIGYHIDPLQNILRYLERMLIGQPTGIPLYFLAVVGLFGTIKEYPRLLFFAGWYVIYHLFFMLRAPLFSWYLHPPLFVLCLFAGLGLFRLTYIALHWIKKERHLISLQIITGGLLLVVLILSNIPYAWGRFRSQNQVELTNKAASLWVKDNMSSGDVVFTEALGYNGYYNNAHFVDWPGLTAPQIPNLLAKNNINGRYRGYVFIVQAYSPDYLMLRSSEWNDLRLEFEPKYQECARFPVGSSTPAWYVICQSETEQSYN